MSDLASDNRNLLIKRYELRKMTAMTQIQAHEIRIMELEEEIQRCNTDIDAQKKVIAEAESSIALQRQEIEKDKTEAVNYPAPKG